MSAIAEEGDEKEENKKGMRELENITDKIKVPLMLTVRTHVFFFGCPLSILDRGEQVVPFQLSPRPNLHTRIVSRFVPQSCS
jgi:hypothetical protein